MENLTLIPAKYKINNLVVFKLPGLTNPLNIQFDKMYVIREINYTSDVILYSLFHLETNNSFSRWTECFLNNRALVYDNYYILNSDGKITNGPT